MPEVLSWSRAGLAPLLLQVRLGDGAGRAG
jgi:hypothetical protein